MPETVYLPDAGSPLRIEYSQAAMEQIRKRARDGLMAAPRIGMGVGGLLLGVREDSRIRLLDSIDLPCSHSAGPSFNLTPDEKRESRELVAGTGQVALVLRPSVLESMRAAFFFRDEKGAVVKGVECDVDEWRPAAN